MEEKKNTYQTVDEYIMRFSSETQELLQNIRKVIREAAPQAAEKISYQMPAFEFHGVLVYYAAYKNHIGFYPTNSGIQAFEQELTEYKHAKGSVQFPMKEPIPYDLIRKIVQFRISENLQKKNR